MSVAVEAYFISPDRCARPAAGTAGFLVGAWDHVQLANSSPDGIEKIDAEGKTIQRGLGDALSRDAVEELREATFYGAGVDPQMVRLATMNLTLHGLDRVRILRWDVLTRPLYRVAKGELGFPARGFDVILASPPFSGRLDRNSDLCALRPKGKNVRQIN